MNYVYTILVLPIYNRLLIKRSGLISFAYSMIMFIEFSKYGMNFTETQFI